VGSPDAGRADRRTCRQWPGARRHRTLNPGATFLEKPFSSPDLARRVRETLDVQLDPSTLADRERTVA
jgi:hypothetical protein